MKNEELKKKTKLLAIGIIKLVENLPYKRTSDVLGKQILKSGTSVGANYRSACRAKSRADFIAKMGLVEEESDETAYWLELLVEAKLVTLEQIRHLYKESEEITAMAVASINTARRNKDA